MSLVAVASDLGLRAHRPVAFAERCVEGRRRRLLAGVWKARPHDVDDLLHGVAALVVLARLHEQLLRTDAPVLPDLEVPVVVGAAVTDGPAKKSERSVELTLGDDGVAVLGLVPDLARDVPHRHAAVVQDASLLEDLHRNVGRAVRVALATDDGGLATPHALERRRDLGQDLALAGGAVALGQLLGLVGLHEAGPLVLEVEAGDEQIDGVEWNAAAVLGLLLGAVDPPGGDARPLLDVDVGPLVGVRAAPAFDDLHHEDRRNHHVGLDAPDPRLLRRQLQAPHRTHLGEVGLAPGHALEARHLPVSDRDERSPHVEGS